MHRTERSSISPPVYLCCDVESFPGIWTMHILGLWTRTQDERKTYTRAPNFGRPLKVPDNRKCMQGCRCHCTNRTSWAGMCTSRALHSYLVQSIYALKKTITHFSIPKRHSAFHCPAKFLLKSMVRAIGHLMRPWWETSQTRAYLGEQWYSKKLVHAQSTERHQATGSHTRMCYK